VSRVLNASEVDTAKLELALATTPEKREAWMARYAQQVVDDLGCADDEVGELEGRLDHYEDYPDLDELDAAVGDQIKLLRAVAKALKDGSHSPNHLLGDVAAIGRELVVIKDKIKPPEA
jgi:hypothetical protein